MKGSVILTVNLQGQIGGAVKSVDKQSHKITLESGPFTRVIKHTDREPTPCVRKTFISGDVVASWIFGECPQWERVSAWKHMTAKNKLLSHLKTFDEGYGVSYEVIDTDD